MGQSERQYAGTRIIPRACPEQWTVVAITPGGGGRGGARPRPAQPGPGARCNRAGEPPRRQRGDVSVEKVRRNAPVVEQVHLIVHPRLLPHAEERDGNCNAHPPLFAHFRMSARYYSLFWSTGGAAISRTSTAMLISRSQVLRAARRAGISVAVTSRTSVSSPASLTRTDDLSPISPVSWQTER